MGHPAYDFRNLGDHVRMGTASDRYASWRGQIYSPRWDDEIKKSKKTLAGKKYDVEQVPIDSIEEYYEHFTVSELDFTFYAPLFREDGGPSRTFGTLDHYAHFAPAEARFLLKAPQEFSARKVRRRGKEDGKVRWIHNENYLNARAFDERFLTPAMELLGDRLTGIIFEQEKIWPNERPTPEEFVSDLEQFFRDVPANVQFHLEMRTTALHVPLYLDWLGDNGHGFVFSHSNGQKPLREQWQYVGERFTAANGEAVVRLLTPLSLTYPQAFDLTHPFDKVVPEIANSAEGRAMVDDAVALIEAALEHHKVVNMVLNNRAYGNAPDLGREIASRLEGR